MTMRLDSAKRLLHRPWVWACVGTLVVVNGMLQSPGGYFGFCHYDRMETRDVSFQTCIPETYPHLIARHLKLISSGDLAGYSSSLAPLRMEIAIRSAVSAIAIVLVLAIVGLLRLVARSAVSSAERAE